MDQHLMAVVEKRIERTVKALNKNRFDAHYVPDLDALYKKLGEYLPQGASCSVGGSMTLFETGIIEYLEKENYTYHDRYAQDADVTKVFHDALNCDVYLTSTNAITENGELLNVDGRGNRVAAMIYGPQKVLVIAGYNKIVKDMDAAHQYIRQVAGPANAIRLNKKTPCTDLGYCVDCKTDEHICSFVVESRYQMIPGRITVLILPEQFGY